MPLEFVGSSLLKFRCRRRQREKRKPNTARVGGKGGPVAIVHLLYFKAGVLLDQISDLKVVALGLQRFE